MSAELIGRRSFLARTGTGLVLAGGASSLLSARPAWAAVAKVGEGAPGFTVNATNGSPVSLASYKGKLVVLEWTNHDCPYVRKHYDTGNMQSLQREAARQGVVWLTVISSSEGTQGYVTPTQADELTTSRKAAPTAVLLDTKGVAGKLYGATNTPHMYVVDKTGTLVDAGAIDDRPTSRRADVQGANNYVRAALDAVAAGQPVKTPVTRAYGCTVKYS
jgi:peroxiredoxin